ncbi:MULTISPECIES: hybrid sensor histidine kinase/response regulator [unclassified Nodularia (in: cyanobacteria)]|uniref:hybrid sensor histidine kinase/response regulator n=1 Tax=unclassified Nodularia (in: cyanobacteria) TaxID=2656917 RepID=UPI00187F52F6|nr:MULTISPECIES: hybrid sensor histidine kinase/response regulator [unclassified Nodularia (in: cyanobacteria)]MBE9200604.1 hybrid sensor histidine kinase/response regulator [Nodularia sp. LEGE 06071]MCC2692492.1 hybrid sensor histidine kinase/response regulator [Nodularia sp. LEGE 04288]
MITDAEIREQGYIYFLAEAPDLLQIIEQELFSLSEEFSIAKVHKLMRATHTLKGGSANVGLEIIKMISHSLEDVFKALYNPSVVMDAELQTLLFQAYECLSLALTTELTDSNVNNEELLQRAALVFAQLQDKLGDAYGAETHIPTSEELGFDIVKSIFESGVNQRLESIAAAINQPPDDEELKDFLGSQAEVFLGLAESLNLPGLQEICQKIIAALQANPKQVYQIAELAFADLQQAQKDVLAGDRTCGGAPSPEWQNFTTVVDEELSGSTGNFLTNAEEFYKFLTASGNTKNEPIKPTTAKLYLKVIYYIFGWFNHQREIPKQELELSLLIPKSEPDHQINYITNWLSDFLNFVQDEEDSHSLVLYRHGIILIILLAVAKFEYISDKSDSYILLIQTLQNEIRALAKEYKNYPPVNTQEKNWLDSAKLRPLLVFKEISTLELPTNDNLLESIWGGEADVNITNEEINQSLAVSEQVLADILETDIEVVAEPAIQNNDQIPESQLPESKTYRKPAFIRVNVDRLQRLNYLAGELLIHQKQRTLYDEKIKEIFEQLLQRFSRHQATLNQLRDLPLQMPNLTSQSTQNFASVNFDSLEMDIYTEFHLSLHEAMEETMQLQETTESLDLLLRQATQISDKKQSLAFSIIDNLVEARLSPLGNVLNRLPQLVKKLGSVYDKFVELKLTGTEVLVDKAIAEKLYEPLLHLVRNAFDHGIESSQLRQERGKTEQGLIEICAYHQGSQTVIEVRDDGQGLNFERIRQKAIELNFIADDDPRGYLSQSELLDVMFFPGLSTADQVNEISGRGMGLDIVRSQLQVLNGSISVQSLPNQGTTFILKIPLSMTTDTLMLVQAQGVVYALLLDGIEKILIPSTQHIRDFEGKRVLHWNTDGNENIVSLHQLSDLIDYHGSLFNGASLLDDTSITHEAGVMKNPVLLLRRNQGVFGLEVDQIIGEQELVIRPLGNAIAPPKYVYGCSSLANGNLILVIDGTLLMESKSSPAQGDMTALLPTAYNSDQKALAMSGYTAPNMPLLTASAPTNTLEKPRSQALESTHKAPKVILVVDDAISLRQTLSLTLQKSGYQVIQAQNGVEALEQLQRHAEIQVIISDLEMPRMNGFELLSNLRQNPNFVNIPIVILTSRSADKHRQLAHELGANAYLTKPYLEHEFLSIVNNLIHQEEPDSTSLVIV